MCCRVEVIKEKGKISRCVSGTHRRIGGEGAGKDHMDCSFAELDLAVCEEANEDAACFGCAALLVFDSMKREEFAQVLLKSRFFLCAMEAR